jgi:drug/metabolite transporter (DMT)-like permease
MMQRVGGVLSRSYLSRDGLGAALSSRATYVAFALLVLVGGTNAIAVRFSNLELPPFWGAGSRFVAAALIFWLIVLARRIAVPQGRALVGAILYGLLATGASFAFLYWALLQVQASLSIVVLALVPLITLFLAWVHGLEALSWRRLIGALVAIAGIVVVVGGGLGTTIPILSFLALLAGAFCIAEGSVLFKLFPKSHPVATNAVAFTMGASLLIGLSLLAGEEWILPTTTRTWAAFTYLVLIGSVLLFYLYLHVLSRWTASATAYAFLLFPVATVPLAALLAGEVITLSFIIGGALGLFGVWLGALSGSPKAIAEDRQVTVDARVGNHARDPLQSRESTRSADSSHPATAGALHRSDCHSAERFG